MATTINPIPSEQKVIEVGFPHADAKPAEIPPAVISAEKVERKEKAARRTAQRSGKPIGAGAAKAKAASQTTKPAPKPAPKPAQAKADTSSKAPGRHLRLLPWGSPGETKLGSLAKHIQVVGKNPHRDGTSAYKNFELCKGNVTVQKYLERGGDRGYLLHPTVGYVAKGLCKLA
jgi:hypothetical protein